MSSYTTSVFIFRRDLRIEDNSALNLALKSSRQVIPCFIFDPRQILPHPYQSKPGLQFMLNSLHDLQQQLKKLGSNLMLFNTRPEQAIQQLYKQQQIQAVFINRDYTLFSQQRDQSIANVCAEIGIRLHSVADYLLTEPEQALKADYTPYQVFTAFYNSASRFPVKLPEPLAATDKWLNIDSSFDLEQIELPKNTVIQPANCGRQAALNVLNQLHQCTDYATERDFPALASTSQLSAHLKFGTCSIREAYYSIVTQLGSEHPLLRQLYWRDFFTHLAYFFPDVFKRAFLDKFANLHWDNNPHYFKAWTMSKTGFPIVDAGMRELNNTGFMHNRVRMIVASFLVKDLHISWRWGERYFAQHLLDYDPCVNNGNWQWAASTGCDAQPYFRIFNPWLQQQKFDPDCIYIYRWLPELKKFPPAILHRWDKKYQLGDYPAPIVDHAYESQLAKAQFKAASTTQTE